MSYPSPFVRKLSLLDFQYDDDDQIGEGNFCSVFKAFCKSYHTVVAMKVLPKDQVNKLRKERDVLMEKHALGRYDVLFEYFHV